MLTWSGNVFQMAGGNFMLITYNRYQLKVIVRSKSGIIHVYIHLFKSFCFDIYLDSWKLYSKHTYDKYIFIYDQP